jgi:hypothetical protein
MKHMLVFTLMVMLASCASTPTNTRTLASPPDMAESSEKDLSGTFLGVATYEAGHKGLDKPAARLYLEKAEGEKGAYYGIILEYSNLLKIAPRYVAARKLPKISKATGYLTDIVSSVAAYKVTPSSEVGVYEMFPLVVVDGKIMVKAGAAPRLLTLSKKDDLKTPIAGATITGTSDEEPKEIFFPTKDDGKINGLQYDLANTTYTKVKLDSTWRKKFLTGPYLSAYGNLTDVSLQLSRDGEKHMGEFKINPAYKNLTAEKRQKMFTNKKSAFLKGNFDVTQPISGMFVFSPTTAEEKTAEEVKGRIGLFIDIFDATKALNEDVVEFALVDSEHPRDFLMYYEHPDNGEGN